MYSSSKIGLSFLSIKAAYNWEAFEGGKLEIGSDLVKIDLMSL